MQGSGGSKESLDASPAPTLGDVLYAGGRRAPAEGEWIALVRAVAARDELALHALYERTHRVVFTLVVRISGSRETAEEVTLDVFHDVWRRAAGYDLADGTVLGWIMNQARSRAIDRVRFDRRQKRFDPLAQGLDTADEPMEDLAYLAHRADELKNALGILTENERAAVEAAFFSGLTHAEVAAQLNEPLGTVKTRIRSALQKLRRVLAEEGTNR